MPPRWTVVIEIDPDLASALRQAAVRAIGTLAEAREVDIQERSPAMLTAFTSDRAAADRLAESARQIDAVTAAYVKPPDVLP